MNIANERPWKAPREKERRAYRWQDGSLGVEIYTEDYNVAVLWDWLGGTLNVPGAHFAMLQICRADGGSVIDWRDLQALKNIALGPQWEAVEMYPASARLRDPSNARILWAMSLPFPFGLPEPRIVASATGLPAPQRPFVAGEEAAL